MSCIRTITLASIAALLTSPVSFAEAADFTPVAHHPNIAKITRFAQNPDIVTPVGIAVAPDGRVFVQENNTHQRPKNYKGHATDRILIFQDSNGNGVADQHSVFYEGHTQSTDLLFGPDGHLYVCTRRFIGRFLNAATKQKAGGDPEVLIKCETSGNYPHNGIGGLAIDPAHPEWLGFGFGENLGAAYTFVGSDGVKISGGGEGGSTYRCRVDGSQLKRVTTGHWNAFGMAFDLDGNLFCTDNDPNSTPPNRLLHIVPGADYGYEYRYGRSGRHPLVTWYGETPGTLGMIGPLGEAACGVIAHGPGQLLTASWTDNRIDLHPLSSQGPSFVAGREQFISGPDDFRPVHFSYSADGRFLYFTDWVKLSYPVHGHGRVWRVEFKKPIDLAPLPRKPRSSLAAEIALTKLGDPNPYIRTEAINVLQQHPAILKSHDWKNDPSAVARAHYAVALKRLDPKKEAAIIPDLLQDPGENARYVGIKWIADEHLPQYQPQLKKLLERPDLSRRDLLAAVAALSRIGGGGKGEFSPANTLLALAEDTQKTAKLRVLALQNVNVAHRGLTVQKLAAFAKEKNPALQREAIRSLSIHPNPMRGPFLGTLASNTSLPATLRADAIAGLAAFAAPQSALLKKLAKDPDALVSAEAKRSLASAGSIQRPLDTKPLPNDLAAWDKFLTDAPGKTNTTAGRRLFFHPRLATCSNCHAMNGRGVDVGPNLTTIHQKDSIDRKWLLEHILDPNSEVAPYFRSQKITTKNGKVQIGLILGQEGGRQGYMSPSGTPFYVKKNDVTAREELPISIMPPGLLSPLTASEIRDLLAYLLKGAQGD